MYLQLKQSLKYSNTVCMKCASDLQSTYSYRLNLITKQQQLYEFVIMSQFTEQDVIIFEPVDVKNEIQAVNDINNINFQHFLTYGKQHKKTIK